MLLTQKDSLRGNRILEIKDNTVKFTYQSFSKRNSYEIPIKNLRKETSESYVKAIPALITGVVTLLVALTLLGCCYNVCQHPLRGINNGDLFIAGLLGIIILCWSAYCFRTYVKSSLDLVIFHDQAGNPVLFLYRTNPNEKVVIDFCNELKRRIENPTGRTGVFQ